MKLAIVSDIHGNIKALDKFIKYIEENNISMVLNAGDLLGGEEPIKILRKIKEDNRFINVAGNHDKSFYGIEDLLNKEEKIWLQNLPLNRVIKVEDKKILMLHSRINSNRDIPILYDDGLLIDFLKDYEGDWDFVVFGHTHYQCYLSFYEGKIMINPGSLGLSYDGKVSFAILDIEGEEYSIDFKKLSF